MDCVKENIFYESRLKEVDFILQRCINQNRIVEGVSSRSRQIFRAVAW